MDKLLLSRKSIQIDLASVESRRSYAKVARLSTTLAMVYCQNTNLNRWYPIKFSPVTGELIAIPQGRYSNWQFPWTLVYRVSTLAK